MKNEEVRQRSQNEEVRSQNEEQNPIDTQDCFLPDAVILEATTAPPGRLPQDTYYIEVRTMIERIMATPVFETREPQAP